MFSTLKGGAFSLEGVGVNERMMYSGGFRGRRGILLYPGRKYTQLLTSGVKALTEFEREGLRGGGGVKIIFWNVFLCL